MDTIIDSSRYPHIARMAGIFQTSFPYFKSTIARQVTDFGVPWLDHFEGEMKTVFSEDWDRFTDAVMGYGRFSLDSMKLQKLFDKKRQYEHKSYEEASAEVYQNKDYMFHLYLPGILLSHFLWSHHYKQHLFY